MKKAKHKKTNTHKGAKKNSEKTTVKSENVKSDDNSIWMITSIALAILLIASLILGFSGVLAGNGVDTTAKLTQENAEAKANEYINLLSVPDMPLNLVDVEEKNGIFELTIEAQGRQEFWSMSADGEYLFPQKFSLDEIRSLVGNQQLPDQQPAEENDDVSVSLEGANALGNPDASVVMVEYSSSTCPFCARYTMETFPAISSDYIETEDVYYVYKHFTRNDVDVMAANAMECAGEQGMFFDFKNYVYNNQQSLSNEEIYSTWAEELDLDLDEFNTCFDERRYTDKITADTQEGQGNGITGTPGFLINSRIIAGAQPFANFEAVIDEELQS